uniref:hypothetical protein n=1 Tax=Streptomyces lavendulae TaxID=1914 RepID=UPI00131D7484
LVGAIRSAGFQVAVQDVFEHRTVAELARHVAGQNTPVEAVELVRPFALIDPLDREMLPGRRDVPRRGARRLPQRGRLPDP